MHNTLKITYSYYAGVDEVTLVCDDRLSIEALFVLDSLTIEIFNSFMQIMSLLREEIKRRGLQLDNQENKTARHVYELTYLVMLDHKFPTKMCKRINHCLFSSLEWCANPYTFPVTEPTPSDITDKLTQYYNKIRR